MDPILIDCLASFPLTWCPCALETKQTQSKHHPYCAAVWGICSMACIAIQFAQSQDPNLSCPGDASMQPPLVSDEIAYIQPQPQCQLFGAPNASSHLISPQLNSFHPHCKFHSPMLSNYMPISLSLSLSLDILSHQIKTLFHTPPLRPYSIGIRPHHIEPESPFLLHVLIGNDPIGMALICQISHQAFARILAASSHDSHAEVHQPSSISKFRTSHHTSSDHHLYKGDLISKTSNLNESSISSNWACRAPPREGGRRKK